MFVLSFSSSGFKKVLICVAAGRLVIGLCGVVLYNCFSTSDGLENKNLSVNNSATDISDILQFISNFGYTVKNEPDEIKEVVITSEFYDVYENYNAIQKKQGYDLREYAGRRVKRWTFTITDYPGYEKEEYIKINVLICDGKVIGGDVCSLKLDGFMHGFEKE